MDPTLKIQAMKLAERDHLVTVYVQFLCYTTHLVGPVLAVSLISHQEFRTARNSESDGNSLASD